MEAKVLERAAEVVMNGWTQGWFAKTKNGDLVTTGDVKAVTFCAAGALRVACRELKASPLVRDKLREVINTILPPNSSLTSWNDQDGRTAEEVADFFLGTRYVIYGK